MRVKISVGKLGVFSRMPRMVDQVQALWTWTGGKVRGQ